MSPANTGLPPVLDMRTAIARFVRDGTWVYLGNFGPLNFAAGHELIRQGFRDLWLVMSGAGVLFDQLVGAGVVERAVIGHCWNPIGPAPTHCWRRAMEHGQPRRPQIEEMTLGSLNLALLAAAYGWPFAPELALAGSGYAQTLPASRYRRIPSPFEPERLVGVVAPLRPEIGIVHAQRADRRGNAQVLGPQGEVCGAALACERVLLVVEELVDELDIDRRPELTSVPGTVVAAIVVEPWAAHPEGVYGAYERDIEHFSYYAEVTREPAGFEEYLRRFVLEVADRRSYLAALEAAGLLQPERLRVGMVEA